MNHTKTTVCLTLSPRITSNLRVNYYDWFKFYLFRTKDNKFVYCALKKVIASVLEKAKQLNVGITKIIHKTDRPSSQFWNSGMVHATKELASEFAIPITHITEQAMHNKVLFEKFCQKIEFLQKDTADGEFSVIKTAIARYLKRSDSSSPDYIEIKDSASVVEFCVKHLSRPGSKAAIDERRFFDIKPDTFLARRLETPEKVKTLAGISSKFQYVCEVNI